MSQERCEFGQRISPAMPKIVQRGLLSANKYISKREAILKLIRHRRYLRDIEQWPNRVQQHFGRKTGILNPETTARHQSQTVRSRKNSPIDILKN